MDTKVNESAIESLFSTVMGSDINSAPMSVPTVSNPATTAAGIKPGVVITNSLQDQKALVASGTQKMNAIYNELKMLFKEREDIIKMCLISVITKQPVLLLGPPGTAKSALITEICDRIVGAEYFGWLLNQMTDISEIFGPFSIKEMENDRFLRITTGKLPEAEIAFMDEVFKCNTPTLNALLTLMNEKIFYNDGKAIDVPLFTLFGASNEPPAEDSLKALHDRFIFRVVVEYLNDSSNITAMCGDFIRKRAGNSNIHKTTITIDEIKAMQQAAERMPISTQIIKSYVSMLAKFKTTAKLIISDRRKNECLKVLQGSAVFNARNTVTVDDFRLLPYALWEDDPNQLSTIQTEIAKIKSPNEDEFIKLKDRFGKIKDSIDAKITEEEKMAAAISNKVGVSQIISKLNSLIVQSKGTGDNAFVESIEKFKEEATSYVTDNMEKYMTFGV